jgi:hypothetical protein
MFDLNIIPECYVDTNLIQTLVPTSSGYNHAKGCPAVAKKMQEKFSDKFSVGIMDNDKRKVSYLSEFDEVANDKKIYVFKHKIRCHYIILISPAVEGFILDAVNELSINLRKYKIPSTLDTMKKETKQIDAKSCIKYTNLFKKLRGASEFKKLARLILYLKNYPFSATNKKIKEIVIKM